MSVPNRPRPVITRSEWGLLAMLAAVHFTNILDFVIVMPLAPSMKKDLQITSIQFGNIVAAYGYASFVGNLLAAKFLDRFGRKSAMLSAYFGFTVSTLACGLAQSYESLVAARAIAGIFGGILGAAVFATIGDVFADYRRGTAMGTVMSAFAVASVIGVPVGLGIAETMGTLAPFTVLAGLAAVFWVGVALVMKPLRGHLAIPGPRASLVHLATQPSHLIAFAFTTSLVLGSFTVVPYIADSMTANAGQQIEHVKYVYLVAGIFTFISTNLIGRLSDRFGKRLMYRALAIAAIASTLMLTNLPTVPLWVAIMSATVFMVTTSGRMVPAQALLTASAAPAVRGGFLSLNMAVQSVGMGVASQIGASLLDQSPDGRLNGYPVVGLVAAASALISIFLVGRLRSVEVPRPAATNEVAGH